MFSYLKVKLFWRHILNPMLQFSTLAVPVLGWSLEDLLCYYLLCRGVDCSAIISALNACSLPKWVLVTTSGHANEPHSDADSFQNNELYTVNLIHNAQTPMHNVLFVQYDGHYFLGYFSNVFLGWKLQNLYHFSFSSTENIIFQCSNWFILFIYNKSLYDITQVWTLFTLRDIVCVRRPFICSKDARPALRPCPGKNCCPGTPGSKIF